MPNAVVTLMRGARYIADTVTDGAGKFRFTGVAPASTTWWAAERRRHDHQGGGDRRGYGRRGDRAAKGQDQLRGGGAGGHPGGDRRQPGALAFREENTLVYTEEDRAVVGRGGAVELKLTARALEADGSDEGQAAIQERVQNVGLYLDLTLRKKDG